MDKKIDELSVTELKALLFDLDQEIKLVSNVLRQKIQEENNKKQGDEDG